MIEQVALSGVIAKRLCELVILSEAKDHLAGIDRAKMILRFDQNDKL